MKYVLFVLIHLVVFSSCSTLKSTTTINPKDSFVLGNNKHGSFKVKLRNDSKNVIEVYEAPIDGGKHSTQIIQPNAKVTLKVDRNTALFITNNSQDTANVNLKVVGDVGLSMGYQR